MKHLVQIFLLSIHLQVVPNHIPAIAPYSSGLAEKHSSVADSIAVKLINGAANTYGYDIYFRGHLLVHQPSIPCINGNKGFIRKKDARRVALLVTEKIRKGIMPPSLTLQELKNLGVLY